VSLHRPTTSPDESSCRSDPGRTIPTHLLVAVRRLPLRQWTQISSCSQGNRSPSRQDGHRRAELSDIEDRSRGRLQRTPFLWRVSANCERSPLSAKPATTSLLSGWRTSENACASPSKPIESLPSLPKPGSSVPVGR